jgi:hypothetical protein
MLIERLSSAPLHIRECASSNGLSDDDQRVRA